MQALHRLEKIKRSPPDLAEPKKYQSLAELRCVASRLGAISLDYVMWIRLVCGHRFRSYELLSAI